jgi:hypothetical protein
MDIFFKKLNNSMLTQQQNRPLCQNCKNSLAKHNGVSKHGFTKWHKYCNSCAVSMYNPRYNHRLYKKNICEKCNFIAIDRCQLDIIYIDNDKTNKSKSNIITLCANCSRLHKKHNKKKTLLDITVDSDVIL